MRKLLSKKVILGVFLGFLLILQFIPLDRSNGVITQDALATATFDLETQQLIRAACYDCHSHETVWNTWSRVAPASFLIVHDVAEGREHFNFSEWDKYTPEQKRHIWLECEEEVESGHMPPYLYTWIHPAARMDESTKARLMALFRQLADREM